MTRTPRTPRLYDHRTVERNIKKGLITRKDYEKHLKALEDVADKGVYGGPADDDDDDRRARGRRGRDRDRDRQLEQFTRPGH